MLNLDYVLTSDVYDRFADMALVSILSVRISNPSACISLLCDAESAGSIKSAKHRVLDVCDEMISIDTPNGEPTFRNRWIKTQLPKFIPGPCIYIDADTLVRGSLEPLSRLQSDFAAVANHNGNTLAEQIWDGDRAVLTKMGWPVEFNVYANGGVFFFNGGTAARAFFASWHRLWKESLQATGRFRDQPSLNTALLQSGLQVQVLPDEYNWQVMFRPIDAPEARILHFYPNPEQGFHAFAHLIRLSRTTRLEKLQKLVAEAIRHPERPVKKDVVGRAFLLVDPSASLPFVKLWVFGERQKSLQTLMKSIIRMPLQKGKKSLAFRIRPFLEKLGRRGLFSKRWIPKGKKISLKWVTMVGVTQVPMLQQCLLTLLRCWDAVPAKIILVSDGSVKEEDLRKSFGFLPAGTEFRQPQDYLVPFDGTPLGDYAAQHPFGLKLAILLKENEIGRTLWCDSDILFFGDLSQAIQNIPAGPICVAGVDWIHGYEPQLRDLLGGQWMPERPVNAGFVLFEAVPFVMSQIQAGLDSSRKSWDWATEQTLVAYFHAKMGGRYWSPEEMVITGEDSQELRGDPWRRNWTGRHYIKPYRQLFWRDVFLLKKKADSGLNKKLSK